jgi:hypothetical protein
MQGAELQILKAVKALDEKLSDALNRQTRTLTQSIQALADRHSESLLEQEKRNASFADRVRVEAVAEHNHTIANSVQSLLSQVAAAEKRLVELAAELALLRQAVADGAVGLLAGANGYLVTFIALVLVGIISAGVARLIR